MTFLTFLGVIQILSSYKLVLGGKTGNEIPELSRLELLEKFLANNFALSEAEDKNSGLLNRGGIADLLLVRTLSNSPPKVPRTKFLGSNGFFCFSSICKFCSFKNHFATINSLSELYFRFRRFILLVQTRKKDFYELLQQHKQLKTMEMCEAWPDIYNEWYIHQFQPEHTHKIH